MENITATNDTAEKKNKYQLSLTDPHNKIML